MSATRQAATKPAASPSQPEGRRLTEDQQLLVGSPGAQRLVAFTVGYFRRIRPDADPGEVAALAREALILAAPRYRPGLATFPTFARRRVVGHVLRSLAVEARARMPTSAFGRSGAVAAVATVPLGSGSGAHLEDPEARLAAAVESQRVRRVLARAIAELPRDQRRVILRRYWDDAKTMAIADEIGCSRSTLSRLRRRAIEHLRGALLAAGVEGTTTIEPSQPREDGRGDAASRPTVYALRRVA